MAVDVAGLKAAVSIVDVVGLYVELKRNGKEFKGLCPFHNDRRPSLCVVPAKEMFWCASCGVGGDAIKFVRRIEACTFEKAVEILGAQKTNHKRIAYPRVMPAEIKRKTRAPDDDQIGPPDMRIQNNDDPPHPWKLVKTWTYYGTRREVLFYVGRYEWWDASGELWKSYRAFTFSDLDGWRNGHWHSPRPLYNLHNLTKSPNLPVCLFEGEKCADAGGILGGVRWVAMTWPGGAHNAKYADLSSLQDRVVIIWPDGDQAGRDATADILKGLRGIAREVWVINVSDYPEKWDAANALEDDGWDTARLEGWLRESVAGEPRMRAHEYGDEAKRAGLLAPQPPPDAAEPPMRPPPREHSDISATAKHWSVASWRSKLIISAGKGKDVAIRCIENVTTPLLYAEEWVGVLAWDELRQRITTTRPTPWGEQPEEWLDHHDTRLERWFDRAGLHYGGLIAKAVDNVAHENSFHPVRNYLNSLKWDGTPRIDLWLSTYCGAPNTPFTNFVGKAWLISAVARAMKPGCQVKTCLILFGKQDAGKSEVFRTLGSPWYAVQHGSIGGDSTKAIEQCSKTWIIEMSELARVKRTEDIESVKSFLSTYEDTYRPAYGRRVMTIARTSAFCGTSNPSEVFNDPTGNVRFWPVKVYDEIDLATLRADRDQIWAEATSRYNAGEKWWVDDDSMRAFAVAATEDFIVRDEWSSVIEAWLYMPENRTKRVFTTGEILGGAIKLEVGKWNRGDQTRVANVMRQLGFVYRAWWYTKDELMGLAADAPKQRKGWRKLEAGDDED